MPTEKSKGILREYALSLEREKTHPAHTFTMSMLICRTRKSYDLLFGIASLQSMIQRGRPYRCNRRRNANAEFGAIRVGENSGADSSPVPHQLSKNTSRALFSIDNLCSLEDLFCEGNEAICKPILQDPVVGHACTKSVDPLLTPFLLAIEQS